MILSPLQRLLAFSFLAFLALYGPAALAQQPSRNPQSPPAARGQAQPAAKPAAAEGTPQRAPTQQPGPRKAAGTAAQPAGGPATLLASYGDWGVYTAQSGRSKICYALTQPKDRQPKNLQRDPAYLFVSFRPGENVRNEVALVMGYPTKENGSAEALVGNASYALLTKNQNAWLKNPAEEGQAISTMSKGQTLTVKVQSSRGNETTDRYSLNGFTQALERARKECS